MPGVRRPRVPVLAPPDGGDENGSVLDPEETYLELQAAIEQAKVGDLIALENDAFSEMKWSVFRMTTRDERSADPNLKDSVWVDDLRGPLHGADVRARLGGGTFEFRGYQPNPTGRGVVLALRPVIAIAGPRKDFNTVPDVVAPAVVSHVLPAVETDEVQRLRRQLRRERRRFAETEKQRTIETQMAQMRAEFQAQIMAQREPAPRDKLSELVTAVASLRQLENNNGGGAEMSKMFIDAIRQGVEIGTTREPVPLDGTDPNPSWIPQALSVAERFITTMAMRQRGPQGPPRPAGAPPPPGRPPEPSTAEVVEPAAPAATTVQDVPHQWRTAVAALYRAMTMSEDPRDFAASLAHMLGPDEVKNLLPATANDVVNYLTGIGMLTQYPALETEQGKTYLSSVLAGLRELATEEATAT